MFDVLGLDWGTKYCGICFGDSASELIVSAKQLYLTKNIILDLQAELSTKPQIQTLVLGYPTNFFLQPTKISQQVEVFKQTLQRNFQNLKVILVNERNSSKDSHNLLAKKNADQVHNLSATKILETYFYNLT